MRQLSQSKSTAKKTRLVCDQTLIIQLYTNIRIQGQLKDHWITEEQKGRKAGSAVLKWYIMTMCRLTVARSPVFSGTPNPGRCAKPHHTPPTSDDIVFGFPNYNTTHTSFSNNCRRQRGWNRWFSVAFQTTSGRTEVTHISSSPILVPKNGVYSEPCGIKMFYFTTVQYTFVLKRKVKPYWIT